MPRGYPQNSPRAESGAENPLAWGVLQPGAPYPGRGGWSGTAAQRYGISDRPCGKARLQREAGFKCAPGPRRAHSGVRTGAGRRFAALHRHSFPRRGVSLHRALRPGTGHTARDPAQVPARPALPSPVRAKSEFETPPVEKNTASHRSDRDTLYSLLQKPRLSSPVQTAGPPLPKILLYTKYIFVTKYNQ